MGQCSQSPVTCSSQLESVLQSKPECYVRSYWSIREHVWGELTWGREVIQAWGHSWSPHCHNVTCCYSMLSRYDIQCGSIAAGAKCLALVVPGRMKLWAEGQHLIGSVVTIAGRTWMLQMKCICNRFTLTWLLLENSCCNKMTFPSEVTVYTRRSHPFVSVSLHAICWFIFLSEDFLLSMTQDFYCVNFKCLTNKLENNSKSSSSWLVIAGSEFHVHCVEPRVMSWRIL